MFLFRLRLGGKRTGVDAAVAGIDRDDEGTAVLGGRNGHRSVGFRRSDGTGPLLFAEKRIEARLVDPFGVDNQAVALAPSSAITSAWVTATGPFAERTIRELPAPMPP